jgi:hypothetical protein
MRRVFGPRLAVEAAFLVAVPTVVGVVLGAGKWTIVAASGVAYLLIVLVEAFLWYGGTRTAGAALRRPRSLTVRRPARLKPQPPPLPVEEEPAVVVRRPDPQPDPLHVPMAEPAPVLQPAAEAPARHEHVRVLERPPEPVERPPLVAVPELEPEPDSRPEPVAAPAPARPAAASTVVPIGAGSAPRRWNLWDLERLTREASGDDAPRDEERTFLLMYLREFADADGLLPVDFDGLVRDSFGELVGSR